MKDLGSEQEIMKDWKGDLFCPLVSISCLAYNHEKYIEDALEGFLIQKTDFPFEILIHDDASLDRTADIIREYEALYPNLIKPIYQTENQFSKKDGTIRRIQITRAKGKYFALCEGDDYWTDTLKLQRQVDYMENNSGLSMCFANSVVIDDNGNVINPSRVPEKFKRNIVQKDIIDGFVPPNNTVLTRNDYLKKIRHFNIGRTINGDFFISCLMAEYGEIGYIDAVVSAYRRHDKGIWSSVTKYEHYISLFNLYESLSKHITNNKNIISLKNMAANALRELQKQNINDLFLEDGYWTPQTAMLRSIRDLVMKIEGEPINALSIDTNPSIEKILLRKWPGLQIDYAKYPEHDVQNLSGFRDESFDIVFSHQVLEHVPKPWLAAKETVRILKKEGMGIHTSCAFNPRHGYPAFKDYYRFLPDGLAELFDGINIWLKDGWGSREALIYNLAIDDGHKELGGRRFVEALGKKNDENYPWHTWVIFQKK